MSRYIVLWQHTIFSVVIILNLQVGNASKVLNLHLGSRIHGTTVGAPSLIKVDNYGGGQALVEVLLPEEKIDELQQKNGRVAITTCSPVTNFDTMLYAFSTNPLTGPASQAKWTHHNDNDCRLQSTIEIRASMVQPLFVLLTGYRGMEGPYEIRADEVLEESTSIPWGLDRIDQRILPLDGTFSIQEAGQGVTAYILDSGVRASHSEFLQRDGSSRVSFGFDFVEHLDTIVDESGHGTHVAALVAGKRFGVAKKAAIVSVRVLDRTNAGFISQLLEALEWTRNDVLTRESFPSVVVLSLSTPASTALNHAVAKMISSGVSVVTAAGNEAKDSCFVSPASEVSALSVGAVDMKDQISSVSNWGDCVGIYAPGEEILSAWHTGDDAEQKLLGTSSACPLVAGAAAVLLEQNPSLRPDEIKEVILATATSIKDETLRNNGNMPKESTGKPLKMLYVRSIPIILRDGSPAYGEMFLYVIFGLASASNRHQTCHVSDGVKDEVQSILISTLGDAFADNIHIKVCCEDIFEAGCDQGTSSHGTRLIVRVSTRESQAYSAFEILTAFCLQKRADIQLRDAPGMIVFVSAQPWVVDSRGYKYWAAPALTRTLSRGKTTLHVILMTCLIALVFVLFGCILLILFRRSRRRKQQRYQDFFNERAAEYEKSKTKHMDLGGLDDMMPPPQFLPDVGRFNSELDRDILETISPSGVLPTPTFNKPRMDRVRNAEGREDRSRNQGFEKTTSFFARLWTPRTARVANAGNSSRGRSPFRGFPRILSFGPEQGAVVQTTSPLPVESNNAHEMSQWGGETVTAGTELRDPDLSEAPEK